MENQTTKTAAQLVREAIKETGMTLKQFAPLVGKTPQALSTQLNSGNMSAENWRKMARAAGYEVRMVRISKDPIQRKSQGPRIRRMVDGVFYDTHRANTLSRPVPNGIFINQLFKDDNGLFFISSYCESDPKCSYVIPLSPELAKNFMKIHSPFMYQEDEA